MEDNLTEVIVTPSSEAPQGNSGTSANTTTTTTSSGNAGNVAQTQNVTADADKATEQQKIQNDAKAERAKYAHLESENQRLNKEYEQSKRYKTDLDAVNDTFKGHPQAYEAFREAYKTTSGVDLGDYSKLYGGTDTTKQKTDSASNQTINSGNNISQHYDEQSLINKAVQTLEAKRGLDDFLTTHQDLDPRLKTDPAELDKTQRTFNAITISAEAYRSLNPQLSWNQALDFAYNSLPDVQQQRLDEEREKGELSGKFRAYQANTGAGKPGSGDSPNITNSGSFKVKMTPDQQSAYNRLAESDKRKGTKIAEKFARNIAEGINI